MRLIDADKLKELYEPYKGLNVPCAVVMQNIDDQPTICLEYETGEWIYREDGRVICSICGAEAHHHGDYEIDGEYIMFYYPTPFCPCCGKKMGEKQII